MIGAIILAAGSSSRMGRSKQFLDVAGEALLARTIRIAQGAPIDHTIVVLGSHRREHARLLEDFDVAIAFNEDWRGGIGTSISAGVKSLLAQMPDAEGLMIMVCDQPLLTSDVLSEIIDRHRATGKPIVASKYADTPGVPVLFGKKYFGKLTTLHQDQGAKRLVVENPADTELVSFPGGEVDLDTMEEYEAFVRGLGGSTSETLAP